MRKFIVVLAALLGAATVASARRFEPTCPPWACGTNGTQLDGIQTEDARSGAVLTAVTLPSGDGLALDTDTIGTPRP